MDMRTRTGPEIVPLIDARPPGRQRMRRRVRPILHVNGGLCHRRMIAEICADEPAVPGPVILGVTGRMHTNIASTTANISLKGAFLLIIKNIAGGHQKDDRAVLSQVGSGESRGILAKIYSDLMLASQLAKSSNAIFDRGMTESPGFRKDQQLHAFLLPVSGNFLIISIALHQRSA